MTRNEDTKGGHSRKSMKKYEKVIKQCFQYVDYLWLSCNILQYLAILMSFWPWCIALWNLPRLWWPRREVRHTQLWRKEWDEKWMKSGWIHAASSFIPASTALYKSMAPLTPLDPLFMKAWHVWHVWDEVNTNVCVCGQLKGWNRLKQAETGWNRLKQAETFERFGQTDNINISRLENSEETWRNSG